MVQEHIFFHQFPGSHHFGALRIAEALPRAVGSNGDPFPGGPSDPFTPL
jgi:hypothetical protein